MLYNLWRYTSVGIESVYVVLDYYVHQQKRFYLCNFINLPLKWHFIQMNWLQYLLNRTHVHHKNNAVQLSSEQNIGK